MSHRNSLLLHYSNSSELYIAFEIDKLNVKSHFRSDIHNSLLCNLVLPPYNHLVVPLSWQFFPKLYCKAAFCDEESVDIDGGLVGGSLVKYWQKYCNSGTN